MCRSFKVVVLSAFAASAAWADLKVGYVDLQRALLEVGEGQAAKSKLKTEMDKKKAELDAEQAKLTDDKAVLDKQGAMMSEEVRTQKFTEWQKRLYEAMQRAQKVQMELADRERTELKKIFEKMDPIIAAIAQREGLTMVFEKTDSGLVYAPPSLDLTNELVRTYNEKFPSKGAAITAAAKVAPGKDPKATGAKETPKDAPKQ
jgi:outer membrane protein